jgi:gliding motility-associated-like protein
MARPTAGMIADYVGCNVDFEASFFNTSNEVNEFFWDFGDGTTSTVENPVHNFPGAGTYQVSLIARDTACIATDTVYETIIFQDTAATPDVRVAYDECSDGELDIIHLTARDRFEYEWAYAGIVSTEANPKIKFENPGIYTVSVSITDSLCGTDYSQNFKVAIEAIVSEIHIPNAFSPNGDGINEQFVLTGDACGENDYLKIYNRWGQIVFETNSPFTEFWDGNHDGQQGKEDVYTYSLQSGKEHRTGYLTLFR